jgi:ribulose-phosphate 3-epimerase
MLEVIPAIMPHHIKDMHERLALVVPYVDMVQLDIMDGRFVKARSWPYYTSDKQSFENLITESSGLPFWDKLEYEIDLMVDKPELVIEDWITAGASRLIVQIESTKNLEDIIKIFQQRFAYQEDMPRQRDVELVLALGLDTPVDSILPYLEDIDGVQFMGIATIGLQGEPLDERVIDRIREFHNAHPEIMISVDGGVTEENAHALGEAGASRVVSGSKIFESGHPGVVIDHLHHAY